MKTIIYSIIAIMMASMVYSAIPAFLQQDKKSDAEGFGFYETFNRTEIIGKLDKNDSLFSLVRIPIEGEQEKKNLPDAVLGYCDGNQKQIVDDYLLSSNKSESIDPVLRFAWSNGPNEDGNWNLYLLKKTAQLGRKDVLEYSGELDKTSETASVLISFNEKGAKLWQEITHKNIGKSIALLVGEKVWFAPVVREEISGGKCLISGNFTADEVNTLIAILESQE